MVNVNDECLVFHIFRLYTMTKRTWKILKLWKTPGFFSSKRVGTLFNPCRASSVSSIDNLVMSEEKTLFTMRRPPLEVELRKHGVKSWKRLLDPTTKGRSCGL